ncbi:MAG: SDR family NAD(P)-dependent oxidoreductase [Actinomycetota bacterium]
MTKTILLTGATDGIGLETAKLLAAQGHTLILHGRNPTKLDAAAEMVGALATGSVTTTVADLTRMGDVRAMADRITAEHSSLDVLINNAGIFHTSNEITDDGLDVRFVVNTFAPYLLTTQLLPLMNAAGRVVNLSSAAQAPVDPEAMAGKVRLEPMPAYAQSKLAITMWSAHLAHTLGSDGPVIVAVNPGSLLATKMVQEGFGVAGSDIGIGAGILVQASLDDSFANASGLYFDNDAGRFGPPHPDAQNPERCAAITGEVERIVSGLA